MSCPSSSLLGVMWLALLLALVVATLGTVAQEASRLAPSGGAKARQVDMPALESRQRAGTLSDHEALFYLRNKE